MLAIALGVAACGGGESAGELSAGERSTTVDEEVTTGEDATSTTATTTTTTTRDLPCTETVQTLGGGEPLPEGVDLLDLSDRNQLAPLPVEGAGAAVVSDRWEYVTRDDFIADVALDDPMQRYEDLGTAGFKRGLDVRLAFGQDSYGVVVMELASPEQAMVYRTAHLTQVCARANEMRAVPGVAGGAAFYRSDTNAARAVVVIGSYEVNLDICTCVEVVDRLALAEQWAVAIVDALQD